MTKLNDITGQRFGRLTAESFERVVYANRMQVLWACRCDCGNVVRSASSPLKRGAVKSCGCWNIEDTATRSRTHGMRHTPTYSVWAGMLARCRDKNHTVYANYGGRGINVCERWHDFAAFLADMGERPTPGHQIEREDNDGDYEPGNCVWADRIEQGANKRNNVLLTHDGRTLTVAQWSREVQISQFVLRRRLSRGWPVSRALTEPVHNKTTS